MNLFTHCRDKLLETIESFVNRGLLSTNLDVSRFTVEPPRDPSHGDMATNVALILAKNTKFSPQALAALFIEDIKKWPMIEKAEIAGPGFINLTLTPVFWQNHLNLILKTGLDYGQSDQGKSQKVIVEYVSANPTGPMHAGHVRGAVVGDALSHLLSKAGYDVTREYYFNDAGTQVDVLARTTYLRYCQALGKDIGEIPEGLYPGDYLIDVGVALSQKDGVKWLDQPEEKWLIPVRDFAVSWMMKMIKEDLVLIGITHQVFTNERTLIEDGTLETSFQFLENKGLIYEGLLPPPKGKEMSDWEPVPLTLFRSSQFGDSTDRPLKKRDGTWAYIMPDIAYHYDKIRRGFTLIINVLGTDHGGYVERMRPVVTAFSEGKVHLEVIFNNIVKIFRNGEPVKISKRSGNLITLREMVEQVGAGAVRFFMLTRDPQSPLDFDFSKVVEKTRDNPVFYVQYAHARAHSVLRHAQKIFPQFDLESDFLATLSKTSLIDSSELAFIRLMAGWPRQIEIAAQAREPHRLAFWLYDFAAAFHGLWNKGKDDTQMRFLIEDNLELSMARVALVRAATLIIASGLSIFGVTPLEEMH
jgi:arginyl-tRNA synthetase